MRKVGFFRLTAVLSGVVLSAGLAIAVSQGVFGQDSDNGIVIDRDASGAEYVSGEAVITYEQNAPVRLSGDIAPEVIVEKALPAVDAQLVSFPEVEEEPDAGTRTELLEGFLGDIEAEPGVASADFNYLRETSGVPNDPMYPRQAYLPDVKAPSAWDLTSATSDEEDGPRIAVIDTGIDEEHPDLAGKIAASTNSANPGASVNDEDGHGTHVAGIAAAATDNETGVAGTCPECALLISKVSDDEDYITSDSVIAGINWAVSEDADVINLSLTGGGAVEAERVAVSRAVEAGVTVVAAAGNERTNVKHYPAAYAGVTSVSATAPNDTRAIYSNYGNWVDLSAPGLAYSTLPGSYGEKTGTSMASPMVAGVAGLLSGEGFDRGEIESAMNASAQDLGSAGKDPYFGYGEIDARGSLVAAKSASISISNYRPEGMVRGRTVTIAATVRDADAELSSSGITLIIDGNRKGFAYSAQTDRLSRKMTFAPGNHRVKIVAADGEGGRKVESWAFRVPGR